MAKASTKATPKATKAKSTGSGFGVHSEVGQLRKVMVCAPGRAHARLTPSNCDQLLFDDVLWLENAKRDHFDFMTKMRDPGGDARGHPACAARTRRGAARRGPDAGRRRSLRPPRYFFARGHANCFDHFLNTYAQTST